MPTLKDPREFITSSEIICGYTSDFGCAIDSWQNIVDPTKFALGQNQAPFQPTAVVATEINAGALLFSDVAGDTMRCGPGSTPLVPGPAHWRTKTRYLRMIVRFDVYGGAARRIFAAGAHIIEMGAFPGQLRQVSLGGVQGNPISVTFSTFRRLDGIWSGAAADTRLRFGSVSAGGDTAPVSTIAVADDSVGICPSNQSPGITVAAAWYVRGRPTDRELDEWDQCDAARYGAGVLA